MTVGRKYLKNVESVHLCFSYEHIFSQTPWFVLASQLVSVDIPEPQA